MPASERDLIAELQRQATAAGLTVRADVPHELTGEAESIRAKWWLGGRKVAYRMSCRLDEADRTVQFREAVTERSWGVPPPTLTVETTTVRGWKRSGERHDVSVAAAACSTTRRCVTRSKRHALLAAGHSISRAAACPDGHPVAPRCHKEKPRLCEPGFGKVRSQGGNALRNTQGIVINQTMGRPALIEIKQRCEAQTKTPASGRGFSLSPE